MKDNSEKNIPFLHAKAFCLECGTNKENPESGYCINGHDNWLESRDDIERFRFAMSKFGLSLEEVQKTIQNFVGA